MRKKGLTVALYQRRGQKGLWRFGAPTGRRREHQQDESEAVPAVPADMTFKVKTHRGDKERRCRLGQRRIWHSVFDTFLVIERGRV